MGIQTDNLGSKSADTSSLNLLQMPQRLDPHENGLRRSLRLREQRESGEKFKRKAHATFGRVAATKASLGMFSLFAFVSMASASNVTMPKHQTNPKNTFTEQAMNRFHEVNELYDGTLNSVHHYMYTTDISANDSFTFRKP